MNRIKNLFISPFNDPSMLWEIVPILTTIIIIEMYFGRYKDEELGWNSALANSLVLIYVGVNLLHYLYLKEIFFFGPHLLISISLVFIGLTLAFLDYHHFLPKRISFGLSSVLPMNFIALLSTIFVHGQLLLDMITFYAAIILFVFLVIIIKILHIFEKNALSKHF